MGKLKKKAMAEAKAAKGAAAKKERLNPFERRFGTEKHKVLNRKSKTDDHTVGKPGISRSKAIQKRKATLLQEYRLKDKANLFLDRRIGEKDSNLSAEDKMIARFAAERSRKSEKKNLFNLAEDDESLLLTHGGKAIEEVEKYDDPRSDDEDEQDEDRGKKRKHLDAAYTDNAHFGGFMTQTDVEFSEGKANSRKEWIEDMIAKSKQRKMEKAKTIEEAETMTQDLDQMWKSLYTNIKMSGQIYTKKDKDDDEDTGKDSYDTLLRELTFVKGKKLATERLKTEDEIIKEDKERLEKLENQRLKRMKGEFDDEENEEQEESGFEDKDEDDESGDEQEEEEDDEEDDDSDEDEDSHEDLDESDEEVEEKKEKADKKSAKKKVQNSKPELTAQQKLEIIQKAQKDLPFTFEVPTEYEGLEAVFKGRTAKEHGVIIERMIKCNHPKLGGDNSKLQLETLFSLLLQFIHDTASEEEEDFLKKIDAVIPFMYDLAHFNPAPSAKAVLSVITEKYEEYSKKPRKGVGLDSVIFLKLALLLFPSSDYRHPVVTPALTWMSQILSQTKFSTKGSIAAGLFVATLFTEAVKLSKRFSPELVNFCFGILNISIPETSDKKLIKVPPFKSFGPEAKLLSNMAGRKSKLSGADFKLVMSDIQENVSSKSECEIEEFDSAFSTGSVLTVLGLLSHQVQLWKDLSAAAEIFAPLTLNIIPRFRAKSTDLHEEVVKAFESLDTKLKSLGLCASTLNEGGKAQSEVVQRRKKEIITEQRKKPQILRLYEPLIEDNFDPFAKKKQDNISKDKLEMQKLLHKMKRERKGAKKDIRADAAFLAVQKAKDMKERDLERMRKTKEILSGLGNQEGEFRQMQRKKGRMKK